MRIKLGDLRKLIAENLDEMKLGVANPWASGQAYGANDEYDDDADDIEYIAVQPKPSLEPDESVKSLYRGPHSRDMAGDLMGDDTEQQIFLSPDTDEEFSDYSSTAAVPRRAG